MRDLSGPVLPISETDFARLLRADESVVLAFARDLPDRQRASLALFCYARTHLRTLGLTVARDCSRFGLTMEGGPAGAALFEQAQGNLPGEQQRPRTARISLSTAAA